MQPYTGIIQFRKKWKTIIKISKEEKSKIIERYPHAHIRRIKKQDSKRHHYRMVEEPELIQYVNEMRNMNG